MGVCESRMTPEEQAEKREDKRLAQLQEQMKQKEARVVKLLLLGTGESGKSTIFKQMQILYLGGFTDYDRNTFRHVVRRNVVEAMRTLLEATERFGFRISPDPDHQRAAQFMLSVDPLAADFWTAEIVSTIKTLWAGPWGTGGDEAVMEAYKNRSKLQVPDSAQYLFDAIERIGQPAYTPTADDILRARLRTSGIVERTFEIHKASFKFIDVGGQRNERRKWIHCFDSVTAVIFVAAISEYDQVLYEDEKENRLRESIKVFDGICNNQYFEQTAMILFLNKKDLFKEKIARVPLTVCFKDYRGDNTYDDASNFIKDKFVEVNKRPKDLFVHMTCATDTQNIDKVFEDVRKVVLHENLRKLGLD